jgi:hypothetical protein
MTALFLVVAAVLATGVLFLATGGGAPDPDNDEPLFLGPARSIRENLREEGPLYTPDPFGGPGLWQDLDADGRIVVYSVIVPGSKDCVVKWLEGRKAYVDQCTNRPVAAETLDRFEVTVERNGDSPKGSVFVDLRRRIPASTSTTSAPAS